MHSKNKCDKPIICNFDEIFVLSSKLLLIKSYLPRTGGVSYIFVPLPVDLRDVPTQNNGSFILRYLSVSYIKQTIE